MGVIKGDSRSLGNGSLTLRPQLAQCRLSTCWPKVGIIHAQKHTT